MTRLQWLWLLIWIFIFFALFCTWDKTTKLYPSLHLTESDEPKTEQTVPINREQIEKKPTQIVIQKVGEKIQIVGHIARQNDKDEIIDLFTNEYVDLNSSHLLLNKETQRDLFIVDLLSTLAEDFLHFRSGIISYNGNQIEIKGTTDNSVAKGSINKKVALLKQKGIEIKESIQLIDLDEEGERESSNDTNKSVSTPPSVEQNNTPENSQPKSPSELFKELSVKPRQDIEKNITKTDTNTPKLKKIQKEIDAIMHNQRIEFLYAKDQLNQKSKKLLDKIATILQQSPHLKIEVGGHTDSDGTSKRNLALSKRRAEAVKRYLLKQGIVPDRIKAVGYGESKPLYPNDSKAHKQRNRRVEFKVMGENE